MVSSTVQGAEPRLMAILLYDAGLRLLECCRLRVKDVDFATNQIMIRDGKGRKDRVTMLPAAVKTALAAHIERVRQQHQAGQNKDLLLKKVNPTGATGVSQVKAGEPLAHENLRRPYLLDGAAISEMWRRVSRLTEIEKRVRYGTEPIVWPPPSP
jgi:integrase